MEAAGKRYTRQGRARQGAAGQGKARQGPHYKADNRWQPLR